jgi:hypothetical protein
VSFPLSEGLESLSGSKLESKESKLADIGDNVDVEDAGEVGVARRRVTCSGSEIELGWSAGESADGQVLKSKNDIQSNAVEDVG